MICHSVIQLNSSTFMKDLMVQMLSGKHCGLQAKLNEYLGEEIYAPYIHCVAHQLNLVLVHVAENNTNASIKDFFSTLQKNYNYFLKSHCRWKLFFNQTKIHILYKYL